MKYFAWTVTKRSGVFYADGRSNRPLLGRHSLGTRDKETMMSALMALDLAKAVELGLVDPGVSKVSEIGSISLADGVANYFTYLRRPSSVGGVDKSTVRRYRPIINRAVSFFATLGLSSWNQVGKAQLGQYAAFLEKKGFSHGTQVMEVTTVKQVINHLVREQLVNAECQFTLVVDKVDESETYCYTRQEVARMVAYCRSNCQLLWLADVLVGLAHTGMRIGELSQLRWSDVDVERNVLVLPDRSRSNVPARRARRNKNRSSRSFPIHDELRKVLESMKAGPTGKRVFKAARGGALRPNNVLAQFKTRVVDVLKEEFPSDDDDIGFKDGTLHGFRHFFCSWCANKGVPDRVVMKWLGHKDSAMVRKYYHLCDDESQRQMKKLNSNDGSETV